MIKLRGAELQFGCDPEFFFKDKGGKVVGAETVLVDGALKGFWGKVIIDGAQVEINPTPSYCRELLGNNIKSCFVALAEHLKNKKMSYVPCFEQVVLLTQDEMDGLSDDCKKFGCMASKNAYKSDEEASIKVDPRKYFFRSAGGHIHLGHRQTDPALDGYVSVLNDAERVIPLMDAIVGNTCVLIDRAPLNVERRKNYGRAGEYRTPPHGLEYRTPSNFWLKNYTLMSLVMGLSRMAVDLAHNNKDSTVWELVKKADIERAINENDVELATKNFKALAPFLTGLRRYNEEYRRIDHDAYPISGRSAGRLFRHFVKTGLDHWFEDDVFKHWRTLGTSGRSNKVGFNNFLKIIVADDLKNSIEISKKVIKQ